MNGRFLLDSNIVIPFLNGDPAVRERLASAHRVYLPVVVVGELYYGARLSSKVQSNLRRIDNLLQAVAVLSCDTTTAQEYGLVRAGLREKGRPIPENDVWIAALGRQHDLTLVSRDMHFREVEGLRMESW